MPRHCRLVAGGVILVCARVLQGCLSGRDHNDGGPGHGLAKVGPEFGSWPCARPIFPLLTPPFLKGKDMALILQSMSKPDSSCGRPCRAVLVVLTQTSFISLDAGAMGSQALWPLPQRGPLAFSLFSHEGGYHHPIPR